MEDVCDTSLCLVLGSQIKYNSKPESCFKLSFPSATSSLVSESSSTLGLSDDTKKISAESHSAMQLISQMGVKKEQVLGAGETEIKRVRRHGREEVGVRKKLRLTKEQAVILEDSFKVHNTLNQKQKQALVKQLNVSPRQLEVWFQNRRARTKLKQMEVDAEYLKKFSETLINENKILQKELDDLKAFKVAPQLHMRLPEATLTLTMCPSCEDGRVINPFSEEP